MVKRKAEIRRAKKIRTKTAKSAMLLVVAVIITFMSVLFPAAFTFGGYDGINYHGFPAGWTGETAHGIISTSVYSSLQYANYIFGFIIDIIFWFFVVFIFFAVTQLRRW